MTVRLILKMLGVVLAFPPAPVVLTLLPEEVPGPSLATPTLGHPPPKFLTILLQPD